MSGSHEEDAFERGLRRALQEEAESIQPRGTLRKLRWRIRRYRLIHRRRPRLHKDARSAEPEHCTLVMPPVPEIASSGKPPAPRAAVGRMGPPGRYGGWSGEPRTGGIRGQSAGATEEWRAALHTCRCGRHCLGFWCCWMCQQYVDLTPMRSRSAWTALHTSECEERQRAYRAILAAGRPR